MPNKRYWKKRFEELEARQHRSARDFYILIAEAMERAGADVKKQLHYWIARFALNNEISMAEAKRYLTARQLRELRWTVEEYIRHAEESAITGGWVKELENASARAHITRLEALQLNIQAITETAFGKENATMEKMVKKLYQDGHMRTLFEIEKGIGVRTGVGVGVNEHALDIVVKEPWAQDGKAFSGRIWTAKDEMMQKLEKELTNTVLTGGAPDEAITKMEKYVDTSVKRATSTASRLVMTESAAISAKAQRQVFEELGVDKYIIVATLDMKTSEICQDMDRRVFDIENYLISRTAPPFHPNCRTTTAPYFEDMHDMQTRAARDKNGKTIQVPADMTYDEWLKKYGDRNVANKLVVKNKNNTTVNNNALNTSVPESDKIELNKKRSVQSNITLDRIGAIKSVLHEKFGKDVEIKDEVLDAIYSYLDKFHGVQLFEDFKILPLGNEIVFQTNAIEKGSWSECFLYINRDKIKGMSVQEIDAMFQSATNTVCNSLEDAIYHEYIHALTASKMFYSRYEALAQREGVGGISKTANKDMSETIAETGVLIKQGRKSDIPKKAKQEFRQIHGRI